MVGDRVVFDGAEHQVVALDGIRVRIAGDLGAQVVLLTYLVGSPGFELLEQREGTVPGSVLADPLDDLSVEAAERARLWERHVVELVTGLAPGSPPGSAVRPEYDPVRSLLERETTKAAELSALTGEAVTQRTVRRMRHRYQHSGLRGLVDGRLTRSASPIGRADPRVIDEVSKAMAGERDRSTGTRDRLRAQVQRALHERYGTEAPAMPSKATFNRLAANLDAGRHTFGAATTRRSLAAKPEGPYTVNAAC